MSPPWAFPLHHKMRDWSRWFPNSFLSPCLWFCASSLHLFAKWSIWFLLGFIFVVFMVGSSHETTPSLLFVYQQEMTSSGLSFVLDPENRDIHPPPSPPHATENLNPKFAHRSSPPSSSWSLNIPWELKHWESVGAFLFPWAVVLGETVVTCFRAGGCGNRTGAEMETVKFERCL